MSTRQTIASTSGLWRYRRYQAVSNDNPVPQIVSLSEASPASALTAKLVLPAALCLAFVMSISGFASGTTSRHHNLDDTLETVSNVWQSNDETVRIRLFEIYRPEAISLSVTRGTLLIYRDGESIPSGTLANGSDSQVQTRNGVLQLLVGQSTPVRLSEVEFVPADSSVLFSLAVTRGGRSSESRTYTGEIHFSIDKDNADRIIPINSVDLETYVAAVTTSEYGLDDLQGNMAMAVLARTYALRSKGKFGTDYDHVDHSISQVYHGVAALKPQALTAARVTAGQVLVYNNELVEALYHAESGGYTADNETVWPGGKPIPYLRGTEDPYANNSPYADWSFTANRSKLLGAIRRSYGGTVSGIQIGTMGPDGRVQSIKVLRRQGNIDVPANEFRLLFLRTFGQYSMKSTLFDVRRSGGSYVFTGRGFGHGVGLSQWGAHEMANRGFEYRDILKFYFAGTEIVTVDDLYTPLLADYPSDVKLPGVVDATTDSLASKPLPQRRIEKPIPTPSRRRGRIGW